jgi:hypothetical protein
LCVRLHRLLQLHAEVSLGAEEAGLPLWVLDTGEERRVGQAVRVEVGGEGRIHGLLTVAILIDLSHFLVHEVA